MNEERTGMRSTSLLHATALAQVGKQRRCRDCNAYPDAALVRDRCSLTGALRPGYGAPTRRGACRYTLRNGFDCPLCSYVGVSAHALDIHTRRVHALSSTLADDLANDIALERSRDLTSDADDDPRFSL